MSERNQQIGYKKEVGIHADFYSYHRRIFSFMPFRLLEFRKKGRNTGGKFFYEIAERKLSDFSQRKVYCLFAVIQGDSKYLSNDLE